MRVAIAHEWCVTYAGSERCVEQLLLEFPGSRLLTTLLRSERMPTVFAAAEPSFLQRIPGATEHHELLLPLMPAAWRLRSRVSDVDVVISSSHACAKAVNVDPHIPHVCYCHTPMRYAWQFGLERERFPRSLRPAAALGMTAFRRWDRLKAARVDRFIANSRDVAQRIRRFYDREADVVHPPVNTDFFTPGGEREEYFLYVGRWVAYKRPDLVIEAFRNIPFPLVMVGAGPLEARLRARATSNVTFVGAVSDDRLRDLLRAARALIFPAHEDFGIVMAESLACGTPVIALDAGGARDIVTHGSTGWLIQRQEESFLIGAVLEAAKRVPDAAAISSSAQRFSTGRFRSTMRRAIAESVRD